METIGIALLVVGRVFVGLGVRIVPRSQNFLVERLARCSRA